jgi:Putative Actinobacterial Holin-X, holin superfamily III
MAVPGANQVGGRPLEELAQTVSQQAVVLAREQADVAGRALTTKAREASTGVAMVGGGALLAALASGTGTAALILLLTRRPGASAAALGVTGAYAGAAAILAREGLVRLREAGPSVSDVPVHDVPAQDESMKRAKQIHGSAKRRTKSAAKSPFSSTKSAKSPHGTNTAAKSPRGPRTAAKSPRRTKSAVKSPPEPEPRASRRRASLTQTDRTRRQAS